MEYTYAFTDHLVVVSCYACGQHFAMTDQLNRKCRETGESFYCPTGHGQCYTDTVEKRLRREQDALRRNLVKAQERLVIEQNSHLHTTHQLRATKGSLTKTKKRIAGGACPCCNRQFSDLARHMAGQHPEYAP